MLQLLDVFFENYIDYDGYTYYKLSSDITQVSTKLAASSVTGLAFVTADSTAAKFAGGTPTLSTAANAIDVVTIFNDGTNYLGNVALAFA